MMRFPKDPIGFSVAFVRRLRMHKEVNNIPSVRQSISIVKLLLAKFERNFSISLEDYIKCAVTTTPLEDQAIARDISWKLLYQQDLIDEFNAKKLLEEQEILSDLLGGESEQTEQMEDIFDQFNQLKEEISYLEELNKIKKDYEEKYHGSDQFEHFFQELEQNREQQPYKDLIDYLGGLDNIAQERIGSIEELKELVKNDLLNQCSNQGPHQMGSQMAGQQQAQGGQQMGSQMAGQQQAQGGQQMGSQMAGQQQAQGGQQMGTQMAGQQQAQGGQQMGTQMAGQQQAQGGQQMGTQMAGQQQAQGGQQMGTQMAGQQQAQGGQQMGSQMAGQQQAQGGQQMGSQMAGQQQAQGGQQMGTQMAGQQQAQGGQQMGTQMAGQQQAQGGQQMGSQMAGQQQAQAGQQMGTCNSLQQKLNLSEQLQINQQMYANAQDPLEKFMFGMKSNIDPKDLFNDVSKGNLSEFLSTINSAKAENLLDSQSINKLEQHISKELSNHSNSTIKDYKDASMSLGKKLDTLPESSVYSMVENSIQSVPYQELMNTADFLDTNFGSDFNPRIKDAFEKFSEALKNMNFKDLITNPNLSSAWRNAITEAMQKEFQKLQSMSPSNADYQFSELQKMLQNAMTQNPDIHTNDFLRQMQGNLSNQYMQSIKDPIQFLKNLDQLKSMGANFSSSQMLDHGKSLKIPEDQLMEILNPGFEFIQSMIQNGANDFDRYQKALSKMKVSPQQIQNLAAQAAASGQPLKGALSALGNKDLGSVLKGVGNKLSSDDIRDVLYGMGAGAGEGLISQWFLNRTNLDKKTRDILKEYIKTLMFELGAKYANMYMGTAEAGPITQNRVRTYEDGDDPDLIDMEETLQGILESGKQIRWIENDDFMVSVTEKGLRSVCLELDISGSMSGEKLSYMAICTAMMVLKMDIQELAISMFESNLHVIKNLDEQVDQDQIADEILEIKAKGGTVIRNAIDWAQKNFKKHPQSKIKINIMFTDAEVFDIEQTEKKFKEMLDDGVQFIFVVPKFNYSGQLADKLKKWTNGIILSIENWKDFPEEVAKLIK